MLAKLRLNRGTLAFALLSTMLPAWGAVAADDSKAQKAVLLQVRADAVEEPHAATAFAVQIAGKVMLGSNRCLAAGRMAELTKRHVGNVVEVEAIVKSPQPDGPRLCTREYMPVYAQVQTTVRGNPIKIKDVIIKNAGSFGVDVSAFDLAGRNDIVVTAFDSQALDTSMNPEAFSVRIVATVEKGSNPCMAAGNDVKFIEQTKDDVVYVRAVRKATGAALRICTMEYNPVFVQISTTVSGLRSEVSRIVLLNADEMGRQVDVSGL